MCVTNSKNRYNPSVSLNFKNRLLNELIHYILLETLLSRFEQKLEVGQIQVCFKYRLTELILTVLYSEYNVLKRLVIRNVAYLKCDYYTKNCNFIVLTYINAFLKLLLLVPIPTDFTELAIREAVFL